MVNYQNGKIYKIINNINDMVYTGSTTQTLSRRKTGHKGDSKRAPEHQLYCLGLELGWENFDIILLETYPCNSKEELEARERIWIEKVPEDCCLNTQVPGRTKKEYHKTSQVSIEYEKMRTSTHIDCDCGGTYSLDHKTHHFKTDIHQHWLNTQETKEDVLTKDGKIICPCGGHYIPRKRAEHFKIKRHLKYEGREDEWVPKKRKKKVKVECPCGSTYMPKHKNSHFKTNGHKHWEETGEILERCKSNKEYYQKNTHKLTDKVKCECGVEVSKQSLIRHQRTDIHKQYLDNPDLLSKKDDCKIYCPCGSFAKTESLRHKKHRESERHQKYLKSLDKINK